MFNFRIKNLICFASLPALLFPFVPGDALAEDPVGIYEDHLNDAALYGKNPTRIRLTKSADVKLGRVGGVWGALGGSDQGDSFFVGKTPDATNLQISITTEAGSAPIRFVFKGTDGQDVKTFNLQSRPGETVTQWISIKGSITVDVLASGSALNNYALYIWYPGGSVDSLNMDEIDEISTGDYGEKPVMFRTRKKD